MFDGDQFHQFIASRTSLPIPLSFSTLHGNQQPSNFSAAFDSYPSSLQCQIIQQVVHHQPSSPNSKNIVNLEGKHHVENSLISTSLALERERSMDPWSNEEVLALLKVRSSMEIWFPDFTWEHVSRKLADLGFKRSAEECKEKFEEESRNFDSVSSHKNYRIFTELDEFYHGDQEEARASAERTTQNMEKRKEVDQEKAYKNMEENSGNVAANPSQECEEVIKKPVKSGKRRKRKDKFEMFKGFCEAVVNKMMVQQEELHKKLIEDILKRDEEKMAREEAWKNEEMDRIKMEIEVRAKEQASAGKRQATIIDFLKKFTSEDDQQFANKISEFHVKVNNTTTSTNSPASLCYNVLQNDHHISTAQDKIETSNTSPCLINAAHQNPSSFSSPSNQKDTKTPSPSSPSSGLVTKDSKANTALISSVTNHTPPLASSAQLDSTTNCERGGDIGKRWPRDEVLALINLRCKLSSNNGDDSKEGAKGPLWERISQGMLELGYKRTAKRCKEKWENINKYFRKTKDSSKKRSIDSRTCPYFNQLSRLYTEGRLVAPTNVSENQ